MLIVMVEGGLGNRLRAFASGWALAKSLGYLYTVVWSPGVECAALFGDLFDRTDVPDVLVLDERPSGLPAVRGSPTALGDGTWGAETCGWVYYDGGGQQRHASTPAEGGTEPAADVCEVGVAAAAERRRIPL